MVCHTRLRLRLERSRNFGNRARLYDTMSALVSGGHRYHLFWEGNNAAMYCSLQTKWKLIVLENNIDFCKPKIIRSTILRKNIGKKKSALGSFNYMCF